MKRPIIMEITRVRQTSPVSFWWWSCGDGDNHDGDGDDDDNHDGDGDGDKDDKRGQSSSLWPPE